MTRMDTIRIEDVRRRLDGREKVSEIVSAWTCGAFEWRADNPL